jgi:hypothetical protein
VRLFLYTLVLLTSWFPSATAWLVHILCDSFVAFVFQHDAANPEHTVARIAWAGGGGYFVPYFSSFAGVGGE